MQDWLKEVNVSGNYFLDFSLLDALKQTLIRYIAASFDIPIVNPIT